MMLLEEMASIFLTPYLLLLVVPKVICCILTLPYLHTIYIGYLYLNAIQCNLLCFFSFFQHVDNILQFIEDFTVDVEGVGHVCRLELIVVIFIYFRLNPLVAGNCLFGLLILYEILFIHNFNVLMVVNNYALLYDTMQF